MARYATLLSDLSSLLVEKAFQDGERIRTEVTTVHQKIETGYPVAAAERLARFYSLENQVAIIELQAKIESLNLEKTLIEKLF